MNNKREHLWSAQYKSKNTESLRLLWKDVTKELDVNIDDPLLEQSMYQQVFETSQRVLLHLSLPTFQLMN